MITDLPGDQPIDSVSPRQEWFRSLARFSWYSVVWSCAVDALISVFTPSLLPSARQMATSINYWTFLVLGLVSGVAALCGVARHGRKGILWPAVVGVGMWLLIMGAWLYVAIRLKA